MQTALPEELRASYKYFIEMVSQAAKKAAQSDQRLREGQIREIVWNDKALSLNLTKKQKETLVRYLEANFEVDQGPGSTVSSDQKPWLSKHSKDAWYYWPRLESYYQQERSELSGYVINQLGNVTDEILDFLGDPGDEANWTRKGLVMGHVQSGKTTNYCALIAKAIDAGYKIIILLAGTTNNLRKQTQERVDETVSGRQSAVGVKLGQSECEVAKHGNAAISNKKFCVNGTDTASDFNKTRIDAGFSLDQLTEPFILVVKKNKSVLENIEKWLVARHGNNALQHPLLLIDDEADNASINTKKNPDETTKINERIRLLLKRFQRASYVGYTATPFANIFINPDSQQTMLDDDLFPRHFIKTLDPPDNYVGADRIFGDGGDLSTDFVEEVDDYADLLPLKHKNFHPLEELPGTLLEALRVFVLNRAIRTVQGRGAEPSSMMINVSRFVSVQQDVTSLVWNELRGLKNAALTHGGNGASALSDSTINALQNTFSKNFGNVKIEEQTVEFLDLLPVLKEVTESLTVVTVNSKGGKGDKLDYKKKPHVIAVGGFTLSRGLTLEGLTVSYILRNAGASDTLMQMARWFGYRDGYVNLCRLYLPPESHEYYKDITQDMAELRRELKRMEALEKTPAEFGLKVRQSPLGIKITARNKMYHATDWTGGVDYGGKYVQGHVLKYDKVLNETHLALLREFVDGRGEAAEQKPKYLLWQQVEFDEILLLLHKFQFPDAHFDLGRGMSSEASLLELYLRDQKNEETFKKWDVAIPHLLWAPGKAQKAPFKLGMYKRSLNTRSKGDVVKSKGIFRITGKKSAVGVPEDARIGLDVSVVEQLMKSDERGHGKFQRKRRNPLLLIYFLDVGPSKSWEFDTKTTGTLSFGIPNSDAPVEEHTYSVNQTFLEQRELDWDDDDEEIDDIGTVGAP